MLSKRKSSRSLKNAYKGSVILRPEAEESHRRSGWDSSALPGLQNDDKSLKSVLFYRRALNQAKLYLILDAEVRNYDALFEIAKQAVAGGVDVLQLRDKKGSAENILKFFQRLLEFFHRNCPQISKSSSFPNALVGNPRQIHSGTGPDEAMIRPPTKTFGGDSFGISSKKFLMIPFIINDRVDLALACGASGVHLGQEDVPVSVARKMMGPEAIIGVSCQNLQQAKQAEQEGADYIGFGSVFKTKTKPQRSPMDLKLLEEVIRKIKIPIFAIGGIAPENILTLCRIGVQRIAVCRAICEAENVRAAVRGFVSLLGKSKQ